MSGERKPILCLDFDGVIHSYESGWKGAAIIPDPPVKGAIDFIDAAIELFDVQIFSSRSHQPGGLQAMKDWLHEWVMYHFDCAFHTTPEYERAIKIINSVTFPLEKPPALVTLDDRAVCFTGVWPALSELINFKPWNKK